MNAAHSAKKLFHIYDLTLRGARIEIFVPKKNILSSHIYKSISLFDCVYETF